MNRTKKTGIDLNLRRSNADYDHPINTKWSKIRTCWWGGKRDRFVYIAETSRLCSLRAVDAAQVDREMSQFDVSVNEFSSFPDSYLDTFMKVKFSEFIQRLHG